MTNRTTDETTTESFALTEEAAAMYEAEFVPALFEIWAPILLDAADVGPGDRVLDVACGTGIVARTAVGRVAPGGSVTGVDLQPAMLAVAASVEPDVEWRQGDVADLPVPNGGYDAAVCQLAFMFFPDPDRALREMRRAVRPGGRVAALVPAALPDQPAYRVFVDVAARHAGPEARTLLGTYWNCGDLERFVARFTAAGLTEIGTSTRSNPARFRSVDHFVRTEIGATPLVDRLDPAAIAAITADTAHAMSHWETGDGFEIPVVCHVVTSRAPG